MVRIGAWQGREVYCGIAGGGGRGERRVNFIIEGKLLHIYFVSKIDVKTFIEIYSMQLALFFERRSPMNAIIFFRLIKPHYFLAFFTAPISMPCFYFCFCATA
jgi:hypothetical protein